MTQYQLVPSPTSQTKSHKGHPQQRQPTAADVAAHMALEAWSKILGLIADGVLPHKAIETVGATRALVEGMLRGRPEFRKQWEDARIASMRRHWDADMLSDICNGIAAGLSVNKACAQVGRAPEMFIKLVLQDPLLREEYDAARKIRAELWIDEQIDIADNSDNDMDLLGKGNTAAVARSKLQVETRQHLAGKIHRERFGDDKQKPQDVNVTVNLNAAERLESARARRLAISVTPVIDAEVLSESPTKSLADASKTLSAERTSSSTAGAAARKRVLGQKQTAAVEPNKQSAAPVPSGSTEGSTTSGVVAAASKKEDRSWLDD